MELFDQLAAPLRDRPLSLSIVDTAALAERLADGDNAQRDKTRLRSRVIVTTDGGLLHGPDVSLADALIGDELAGIAQYANARRNIAALTGVTR